MKKKKKKKEKEYKVFVARRSFNSQIILLMDRAVLRDSDFHHIHHIFIRFSSIYIHQFSFYSIEFYLTESWIRN